MKILWITNVLLPEAQLLLNGGNIKAGSGGWLSSAAEAVKGKVELIVASPTNMVQAVRKEVLDGITYYFIPIGKGNVQYNKQYEKIWYEINEYEKPDLVHLHGTEYSHGLAFINACGSENVIVSIQGIMTEIAKHRNDGLSRSDILRNITIYDLKRGSLFKQQKRAKARAESEIEIMKKAHFFIGRTSFDYAYVKAKNPAARYYHCDESMREVFYTGRWSYDNCQKHSIYVSSASYPLKGLHMLLQAMPIIINQYPDIKVFVAGRKIHEANSFVQSLMIPGYDKILNSLIKKYNLKDYITFVGPQDARGVRDGLLKANLFLSPSSNENSSNSICEAQLLGVPCLASYVGGTPDLISSDTMGCLYNYYDINVLAYKICMLFENSKSFDNSMMVELATVRNNRENNALRTIDIYKTVKDEISK